MSTNALIRHRVVFDPMRGDHFLVIWTRCSNGCRGVYQAEVDMDLVEGDQLRLDVQPMVHDLVDSFVEAHTCPT